MPDNINDLRLFDVLGKLFTRLDPKKFNECFIGWANTISELTMCEVVAIDGKSLCGSAGAGKDKVCFSCCFFLCRPKQVMSGQVTIDQKQNEIVAIPGLLDLVAIKGCIVTIDAMGCQKEIK